MNLIIATAAVLAGMAGFALYIKKYANPYKLIMIFGKKGSGKTTLLAKIAVNAIKEGKTVYTTIDIPGTRKFRVEDIGAKVFPPESIILIDEAGIVWDNRNFKNFRPEVRDYFKYQRQYRNTVYLFSQTFDVDIKLRNLTDSMYLCRSHGGVVTTARRILRQIILTQATGESESRIADNLIFETLATVIWGGKPVIFTWIPKWVKFFKSYNPPEKPYIDYTETPGNPERKPRKKQKKRPLENFEETLETDKGQKK